ncbi:MAG: Arm DNA-binding domain-containing protein, partial [Pseudomonadota bacterium]
MVEPRKIRLTKTAVEGLRPAAKTYEVWDAKIPGFGVRVLPSGTKTYFLKYRSPRKRTSQTKKIGRHGQITAEEARRAARSLSGQIAQGGDPASDLAADRAAPDVDKMWAAWFAEHVEVRLGK